MMRIISGNLKGRTLFAPKSLKLRPTSDPVKESLFNIIGQNILQGTFLDIFAGTGSIGIEALSRGAERAVFVEKNRIHLRSLKHNLTTCGLESKSTVYCGDANKIIPALQKAGWCFDVIFLDPPYRQTQMLSDILHRLAGMSLLFETGLIVVEHAFSYVSSPLIKDTLRLTKTRRIGDTVLSFYGMK